MESMPFKISISNELLSFIHQRVSTARIPLGLDLAEDPWSYGNTAATISHLRDYWEKKYDWRAVEARINGRLKMFTLPIKEAGEDLTMHFVHHRSIREGAVPLLSQHGWPGNFTEVDKIIDSLTFPTEPGQQAYHVVAPSLPGFVFSDGPKGGSFVLKNMAAVNNKLMHALGYEKYMVQGGDWGNIIARIMAVDFPENCVANSFQLYLIPGTAGHVEIYKNVKGKKGEAFESDFLSKIIPRNVDFGASIFPRGMSTFRFSIPGPIEVQMLRIYPGGGLHAQ